MKWFVPALVVCVAAVVVSIRVPAQTPDCAAASDPPVASDRDHRFLGKVTAAIAQCRGGARAVQAMNGPFVDWQNYYGAGDARSLSPTLANNRLGVMGALQDLNLQMKELLAFNLFESMGTFRQYIVGRRGTPGPQLTTWSEMRLPPGHPQYTAVGGAGPQLCTGALIRGRTLTGICNDLRNPLMGSTDTLYPRNVDFDNVFFDAAVEQITRNRHGTRLALLRPDPQLISRLLFTRAQSNPAACAAGLGRPVFSNDGRCDYDKAAFFNVLAAFWIQFMTHDWFSHLREGHNDTASWMPVGCDAAAERLGCRPGDRIDRSYVAETGVPGTFTMQGETYLTRPRRTFRNTSSGWWDASQLYGYDTLSRRRVKRDPKDRARLEMVRVKGRDTEGDRQGYLPVLLPSDPKNPGWAGQEAAAFADNWTVGISFFHNVFAREHNQFVDAFRAHGAATPDADSGLRDPARPATVLRYRDVTPDELFEAARLVVSAEIAKIHTIEWTTQLLYDEPLFLAMNTHWGGLPGREAEVPGIVGRGSQVPGWSLSNPDAVNGGTTQYGSPFNLPEEFVSVYRLHPLVPDLIEYREFQHANTIRNRIPVAATFQGQATTVMRARGLANWAISMGRQRVGTLTLQNHPLFLQNLRIPRLQSTTKRLDIAALDVIRDRERGVPRFNEFRRQYGLRQFTSFAELVGASAPSSTAVQKRLADSLRQIYGRHMCNASKVITTAQLNADGTPINDCLGQPNGSLVDNIEDVDTMVGWLAEATRPHGFAISETQFSVFILNASRRLYSDRFLTSSFRPEFYSTLGLAWVNNNGPTAQIEPVSINGRANQPVAPLKRVLLRVLPELKPELDQIINAFDPWARNRGVYYSLDWVPRKGSEADESFSKTP